MALEAPCGIMEPGTLDICGSINHVRAQVVKHLQILHDLSDADLKAIDALIPPALEKVERCWSEISSKYYRRNDAAIFDVNHSNQYCQFLLILAHQASSGGHRSLADRIFSLNKMMNGCDIYHEIVLPECFYIDHSLGIVLGRAKYGERLYLSQNCTIGSNPCDPRYPELGADNFLMSSVTIIGTVKTGSRVIFATGSYAKDIEIPDDSIVFGRSPDIVIKKLSAESFKKASPFITR